MGGLLIVGGIGLLSRRRWVKVISSGTLAAVGCGISIYGLIFLPLEASCVSALEGSALCIPLLVMFLSGFGSARWDK